MILAKWLLATIAAVTLGTLTANAEADNRLAVAIGTPGSDSFTFGIELWAMSQIALMPTHGIALDSKEVTADKDRLSLLQSREVEAALVYGRVPNAYDNDVRAIMALWPRGISSNDADPVQFLVHKDVAVDTVYLLTKAMFEHANYFKTAHASLGIGLPSEAMTGLDIPLHAGAFRYYEENGFGLEATVTADYWGEDQQAADGEPTQLSSIYRNFDDASFQPNEIEQIAAACRQALEIGSLSAVLGDLDNTGCEVYQDRLLGDAVDPNQPGVGNAPAVAAFATSIAVATDGNVEDDLAETPFGQGGPWVPSEQEVSARSVADPQSVNDPRPSSTTRVIRQPTM